MSLTVYHYYGNDKEKYYFILSLYMFYFIGRVENWEDNKMKEEERSFGKCPNFS